MAGQKKEIRPGVWLLRVSVGKHPITQKYVYISKTVYDGQRVADQELAKLLVAAKKDPVTGISLARLLEEFFALCETGTLAIRTLYGYRELARNHILPNLYT